MVPELFDVLLFSFVSVQANIYDASYLQYLSHDLRLLLLLVLLVILKVSCKADMTATLGIRLSYPNRGKDHGN